MRKLSAHYIFPAAGKPLKYGILILDDEGQLVDLIDTGGKLKEESKLEFYPGILVPGFVNAHCHLELSHLKNQIPQKTGISNFIQRVTESRLIKDEIIEREMKLAIAEMYRSGISALGDISNTSDSIRVKKNSPVYCHSFVEIFGLKAGDASSIWKNGKELKAKFEQNHLPVSISPHAPYSISQELWSLLNTEPQEIMSMHNQESLEEEALMSLRKGKMADLFNKIGFEIDSLPPTQSSSLESVINFIPRGKKILLVHNTHTGSKDIATVYSHFRNDQVFWVLCPNSNLYIENSLPKEILSKRENLQFCLGTDSLASNTSLSMFEEMKTIQNSFPLIKFEEILSWATLNGARALGIEDQFGSFEAGKKPGVVWINNIDHPGPLLTSKSQSLRLV